MRLPTELYIQQARRWPPEGRHILAHYDAETIVVYQAYRASIGEYAIQHGVFGGEFSYSRMSWIKPNFLWMMYRSGWGTKEGQDVIIALRLRRRFFDNLLARAVASHWGHASPISHHEWRAAIATSDVRLQWDPDHEPHGRAIARRAIQLGLRGEALKAFGKRELLEVVDMTNFVAVQRSHLAEPGLPQLRMPVERTYMPADAAIAGHLTLD
jgi:hypothetical protein